MQELVRSRIDRLLDDEAVAHVAVIADGAPYVTPVSFVWHDEHLYFRSGPGRRLDALAASPRVSVELSRFELGTGTWESVIVDGEARVIDDADVITTVERALRDKYRRLTRSVLDMPPDVVPLEGHLVEVSVKQLSGRASGSGATGHVRPGRL